MKTDVETTYINNLIKQGEHQQLDFKFAVNDSRKIAKSLVAFANTDGGTLLLGVKDNGVITGVKTEEEFYMVESAAQLYSKPEIYFRTKAWRAAGKLVMEVIVPRSEAIPHFAQDHDGKWLAYIRKADQNLMVNGVWLKVLEKQKSTKGAQINISHKEKFLLSYLEENQSITFSKYCKLGHVHPKQAEEILVNFIVWDMIEIVFSDKTTYYKLKNNAVIR